MQNQHGPKSDQGACVLSFVKKEAVVCLIAWEDMGNTAAYLHRGENLGSSHSQDQVWSVVQVTT